MLSLSYRVNTTQVLHCPLQSFRFFLQISEHTVQSIIIDPTLCIVSIEFGDDLIDGIAGGLQHC